MCWLIQPVNHHSVPASADLLELLVQVTLKATMSVPNMLTIKINYQMKNVYRKYNPKSIFQVQPEGDLLKVDLMTV